MLKRSSVSGRFATFDAFFAPRDEFQPLPEADRVLGNDRRDIAFEGWSASSFRENEADLSELASEVLSNAPGQESTEVNEWEPDSESIWESEWETPDLQNRETFFFISHGRLHQVVVWPASEWSAAQENGRHVEAFETSRGNYATVHAI